MRWVRVDSGLLFPSVPHLRSKLAAAVPEASSVDGANERAEKGTAAAYAVVLDFSGLTALDYTAADSIMVSNVLKSRKNDILQ